MRPDYLDTARKALAVHHPGADCALVAGSIVRGRGTPTSDIDLVVLYPEGFEAAERHSIVLDGWPIEMFMHCPKSLRYYFEQDRALGVCTLATMVSEGIEIPEPTAFSARTKALAKSVVGAGPLTLSPAANEEARYLITNLIDDVAGASEAEARLAALRELHDALADFHLRAQGKWTGRGKALTRLLQASDPDLASALHNAYLHAHDGETAPVLSLAERIIAPYGGRVWDGFRRAAPADWKEWEPDR